MLVEVSIRVVDSRNNLVAGSGMLLDDSNKLLEVYAKLVDGSTC